MSHTLLLHRLLRGAGAAALVSLTCNAFGSWKPAGSMVALSSLGLDERVVVAAVSAARPFDTVPGEVTANGSSAADKPPVTVTGVGPGQAGYVHYFLLLKPDGTREMQIGIELADQSIAWALADDAIEITPFMPSGSRHVNGRVYRIEHLFGVRPFRDDAAMARLARDLPARIMPWIEDRVQHCDFGPSARAMCVSCLGFVLRMLFPAEFPLPPALPADFRQARLGERYTTEDLLLYMTGLHTVATREAKLQRIGELDVPPALREELVRLASVEPAAEEVRPASAKPRRSARADGKARPGRLPAPRRL